MILLKQRLNEIQEELVGLISPREALVFSREGYSLRQINALSAERDALAARVQGLEAALRRLVAAMDEPRQTYPVLSFARTEKEAAALVEARAALTSQATEETT